MMKERRQLTKVIWGLLMFGVFLLGNTNLPTAQAAGEVWTFRDGNLSTGLNKDTVRHAINPAMTVFNNELYVAWSEMNATTSQIRLRKYDGSTWSWVDGGGTTGINYNTAQNAILPNLMVFSGNLYAIWSETYSGVYVTRVKRYDGGSTWTAIDGSATNGLNKDSVTTGSVSGPSLGVCNGYLYAAWIETYSGAGGAYQLHVKRYDSGTTWTFVDGGGFTGLNYDTNRSANKPKLLALNNTLYLVWTEANPSNKYIVRVKRYDGGSTWTTVDGGSGLNYNSGNTVDEARLAIHNNSLYAYWLENYFVRMKSYNGSAWSTADGNAGFKQNALNYAYAESPPAAIPYGNKLYFTWGEDISYDPWSIQTRSAYYYSGAMTFIDGNDWTTGLNYNRLQYAYRQAICEYNGVLYVAWYESNGSANQVRLRSTPLPAMVTSVTNSGSGVYGAGQNFDLYVTFNKAVNVTGTPVIPITLTSGVVNAAYISGSGTATLAFRFAVAAGDADADGITVGTGISLAGGTIRDTVNSLDADLSLNNVTSTTGVLVDGVAPSRTSTNPADNATGVGVNQNLIIYFSENISKGTGNIRIRKSADYSIVETIAVTSATVTVSGNSATIDPSVTLANGTGYYVTMDAGVFTDAVGNNFAGILTYTVWNFTTIDTDPPSGYAVSIDQPYINNDNKTAMSFTFAGAEVGTTYNYTLTSSGGGTPLTGSGAISSATQQVTGVSTFGLNEGTLTLSVTLTDISLNTGAPATATVLKDTLMPNAYSVAIDQSYINNSNKNAVSFVISGAETGASYGYSITSSGGGTTVNGSGTVTAGTSKSVTGIDTTGLSDGVLTVSLTMTDLPGNPGLPVTDTVIKDVAAPVGYGVSIIQSYINNANKAAFSFSFTGAEVGTTYNYSISGSGGGTPVTGSGTISTATQTVNGVDVSGLNDGTLTLSATLADIAGNAGTAVTPNVIKDTAFPAIDSGTVATGNGYLDIAFSEGGYGAADGTTPLTASKFLLVFTQNGGNATNAVVSSLKKNDSSFEGSATNLTGGETIVRAFLNITGAPSGVEIIEIKPVNGASVFDKAGNAMSATETSGAKNLKDTLAPTAALSYTPAGPYKLGDTVTIAADFSEPVADSPVMQIAISAISGGSALPATNMTKVSPTRYSYVYLVGNGNGSANVTLATGKDLAGNPIATTPTSGGTFLVMAPPAVVTTAAGAITATGATLNGMVNDNGSQTTVSFDYGTTTAYGFNAPATTGGTVGAGAGNTAAAVALTGLACNTTYHFRARGTNSAGTATGNDMSFTTSECRDLTVFITGTGSVHGTSTLGQAYSCASGTCPATPYTYGDHVTLTAIDSADYHFAGWSGDCSATSGPCNLEMTADRSVAATFSFVQPVRLSYQSTTQDYATLADAYGAVADNDSATLYCRNYDLTGGLTLGRPVTLLLMGGYNVTFGSNASGWTTLQGALTVGQGTLTVERFVVR